MKAILGLAVAILFVTASFGQDCSAGLSSLAASRSARVQAVPTYSQSIQFRASPAVDPSAREFSQEELKAELDFIESGPRLYPMDKAIALGKASGKPVVCWMGKHIFANAEARRVSKELGETTIQAAMDTDGVRYGSKGEDLASIGPRIKFSADNYAGQSKTYYVPVSKFTPDTGGKVLTVALGASPSRR